MYIAVILENFSQAREEVQQGLTDDDYDMYYEVVIIFFFHFHSLQKCVKLKLRRKSCIICILIHYRI